MKELSTGKQADLESMIDEIGCAAVIAAMASIAHEKADHVMSNWQDAGLSKEWTRLGKELQKAADRIDLKCYDPLA